MEDHELLAMIKQAMEEDASDLHLAVGFPPTLRKNGNLVPLNLPPLRPKDTERVAQEIIPSKQAEKLRNSGECDFSYSLHGLGRFRVSFFRQRGTFSIVMRIIDRSIPSLDNLGLPPSVELFTQRNKGLVLVGGPASSGKSTTLAALLEKINSDRRAHIISLENPIEFLHTHNKCIVNQREIGQDSVSFPLALKSALRQDPNVIFLGEMRDLETVETVFAAAESGCLIFGVLNSLDVLGTIERLIEMYPPYQQHQARIHLASVLEGIIIQKLLPKNNERGMIAATEVLVGTLEVKSLIKEGKIEELYGEMEKEASHGMQTMDASLKELVEKGLIKAEDAMINAVNTENFKKML